MTRATVRPWQESVVGGHGVPAGCVVRVPAASAADYVAAVAAGLTDTGFQPGPVPAGTAAQVRLLRRGSLIGDTLLTGTGLAALRSRIGPLSLRASVVIEQRPEEDGSVRIITAMIAGDALAAEVAAAVDAATAGLSRTGVPVEGPGWMRAVDVPEDSLANPRTAQSRGMR
ncbi:hypothetical protein F6J84_11850 [Microbacterium caowuchunii]|uniref:hypothetical protein n=1 Tax=Microbacterium caowuchunii TaxID=2614638 RepID=UPI0012493E57|nr:hypothetical protein [Microbacterium caowuchunii]QEW00723.1 hypothetical protein F6J84_11850 [Microbacterium caowuchunii]